MKESEIIIGNDEICQMLGWKSDRAYMYHVPNLFPIQESNNTTEMDVQGIGFHLDWNMCIGAYNKSLELLHGMNDVQKELLQHDKHFLVNFSTRSFFHIFEGQLHISSCYVKLVMIAKWYNSIKLFKQTPVIARPLP